MVDIKRTLDEFKDILNTIKTKQDAGTAWSGTEKDDIEKRIKHVLDKSQPRHTNLTADLDIDLKELENVSKAIGEEKMKTDIEMKKVRDEKGKLETDLTAKDNLLKQKDEEIGGKITKDLMDKLEAVSKMDLKKQPKKNADGTDMKDAKGNIVYEEIVDLSKLEDIKTIVDELKTKGTKVDTTDMPNKQNFEEIKSELQEVKNQSKGSELPSWAGYGILGAVVLSFFITAYAAFFKKTDVHYSGGSRSSSDNAEENI